MSSTITITKAKRTCINCKTNKSYLRKEGYEIWYNYKNGKLCQKCRAKLIDSPKWDAITNARKIRFKGKRITVKANPRTGQCSFCNKKVGDEFINSKGKKGKIQRTSIHHVVYDNDPMMATIELCNQCHTKLHWKHKKKIPIAPIEVKV